MAFARINKNILKKRIELIKVYECKSVEKLNGIALSRIHKRICEFPLGNYTDNDTMRIEITIPEETKILFDELKSKLGVSFTQQFVNEIILMCIESGILQSKD